jgi:thiol-disulfide isomerase/thioredoxin
MNIKMKLPRLPKQLTGTFPNVVFFIVIFVLVSMFQTRNMLSNDGVTAPELKGSLLRGGTYNSDDAGNRPVLIYFFAPWCNFCAASSDNLTRLRRMRDEQSLEIVTVALDWQTRDEVKSYVESNELNLPVVLGNRQVAQDWHVVAFPTYYVLNSNRQVQRRDLGYSTQIGLWWRTWLVD